MAVTTGHQQLPCGVALDALVVQIAEDQPPLRPTHQKHCPYCQEALRTLVQGWDDFQALTSTPVKTPPALTTLIMARVHGLARQVAQFVIRGHPRGTTRISHTVIARIVTRHAAAVPGVVFASAQPVPHDPPEPGRLSVNIRLVVSYGPTIETLARAVRQRVLRRVPRLTGTELSSIDITVDDIAGDRD